MLLETRKAHIGHLVTDAHERLVRAAVEAAEDRRLGRSKPSEHFQLKEYQQVEIKFDLRRGAERAVLLQSDSGPLQD